MKIKQIKISHLPKELQEDFKLITFGNNYHLIGSASVNSITYSGDYDLNQKLIITDKQLKEHIKLIKSNNNIWLISVHNTKDYIQINTIANINGVLTDINNTIFHDKQPSQVEKQKSLKKDIHELIQNGNYFKAVKRLYTLYEKNKKMMKYIIEFLNSNIGLLSSIINQLEIIKNFYQVEKNRNDLIFNNLQLCLLKLNKIYCIPIENEIYKMFSMKNINKLINILNHKLQLYTKHWVHLNRRLFGI